ncbi:class I SAM-dependent methyltransferase [Cytobacillus sp. IB215665]|uniref:class I SAM-dependent DNA methyltransferase n=1 Tax=Cytobacillus sp. IB215665 TaxID=3097357 RepID=UPI002A11AE97|nr:class I SAM-dependent methyltransferase [Cytobacillus sp. IB215665]MDX8364161.1 class I SAM-dependent methyltransferase [Cytobacillus sp. IB215665]
MTYNHFAYYYDRLMKDAPYDLWLKFTKENITKYRIGPKILDLACGTGELSIRLADEGFDVTGVDMSEDMLAVALEKSLSNKHSITFIQKDMRELSGFPLFDCVLIFCDSLNYLIEQQDVQQTFRHVYNQLEDGGLLMFDVHSVNKISNYIATHTFAHHEQDISYIWQCFDGELSNSVEHDLAFFVREEDTEFYARYDETHTQRTFLIDQYEQWLVQAGFTLLSISGDFTVEQVNEQTERIFFVARK